MIYTTSVKCLCSACEKNCSDQYKSELAMSGKLTYLYMKDGRKLASACSLHTQPALEKAAKAAPLYFESDRLFRTV